MANNIGKITQIISAVLDIKFTEGNLPEINEAIKIPQKNGGELVVEVSQHLGDDTVRCIAMGPTDGLEMIQSDVSPWDQQTDSFVEWMQSLRVHQSVYR